MLRRLIVLSGPIASGKSMLARQLVEKHGALCFRTKEWILQRRPKADPTRLGLQKAGEALDHATRGQWVVESLARELQSGTIRPGDGVVVVDSVRIPEQVEGVRKAYGGIVVHIHLTASDDELRRRYNKRDGAKKEPAYEVVKGNSTEKKIERLAQIADAVINSDR